MFQLLKKICYVYILITPILPFLLCLNLQLFEGIVMQSSFGEGFLPTSEKQLFHLVAIVALMLMIIMGQYPIYSGISSPPKIVVLM